MVNKFELNEQNVKNSIKSIISALNATTELDIRINSDKNNTAAYTEYKKKVENANQLITTDVPKQITKALGTIGNMVDALKKMDEELKKEIKYPDKESKKKSGGQGGNAGFSE